MSFSLSNPTRKIVIGVLLMNSNTEILDVAPVDLLYALIKDGFVNDLPFPEHVKAQGVDMEIVWINEKGDEAKLTSGATMKATHSFETAPPVDIVLIGAPRATYTPSASELAYIRKVYESCSAFLCICGGLFPALYAGLLEGKTATAPRITLGIMRQQAPGVNWVDRRYVNDGKMWTSGTLLSGLDLMQAFVRDTWEQERKELVEGLIEVGHWPKRSADYAPGEGLVQF